MPISTLGASVALAMILSSPYQEAPATQADAASGTPAQGQGGSQSGPAAQTSATVVVTAQKEPAEAHRLPVSLTVVPEGLLRLAGVTFVSDAGVLSPNTQFSEFSARKLSNPRVRGIGASPANPGVVTYMDGVPQFSSNSSSIDLVGVSQIEFVRGAQSPLFGRNALGGIINITSSRPSMTGWNGDFSVPAGSDGLFDVRTGVSGPLVDGKLAAGLALAFSRRDGFSTNSVTGNDLDSREGVSGKGQLLWTPAARWEVRAIVSGERARDGDYALADLGALRQSPFSVARDFEGRTDRDITSSTILARHEGARVSFSSTTGIVRWKTVDATDLDYSPFPIATRDNREEATQVTQEFRLASAAAAPVSLSDGLRLRWQAGAIFFAQDFEQDARNNFAPFVLSPFIPFPVSQQSPLAVLEDSGVGVYGQGTLMPTDRLDVTFGVRVDRERRTADLRTAVVPDVGFPATQVNERRVYTAASPQVAASFEVRPGSRVYASAGRAFKAGGFNPVSLPGEESYAEEFAWHVEGGVKTSAAGGRFTASAAVFSIDWDDLQLNRPIPGGFGQFYIANIGGATSRGAEFELTGRVHDGVDVFGAFGFTRARFDDGTTAGGVDVSDRKVPFTPSYTATFGALASRTMAGGRTLWARAEIVCFGAFEYDEANTERQEAYEITNLRAGLNGRTLFVEAWVRNAFNTTYIPVAFAYPGFAPSGFIGEPGRPRTAGVSVGVRF